MFAVQDSLAAVDLTAADHIAMAAGAIARILALVINRQCTHTSHERVERRDDRRVR